MVQIQSTSELCKGPQSSVPAPSAKDVYIGSCAHIASATIVVAFIGNLSIGHNLLQLFYELWQNHGLLSVDQFILVEPSLFPDRNLAFADFYIMVILMKSCLGSLKYKILSYVCIKLHKPV